MARYAGDSTDHGRADDIGWPPPRLAARCRGSASDACGCRPQRGGVDRIDLYQLLGVDIEECNYVGSGPQEPGFARRLGFICCDARCVLSVRPGRLNRAPQRRILSAMKRTLLIFGLLAITAAAAIAHAQGSEYPQTVIAPGKGPFDFPQGYQTPWDKIQILVKEKLSPNLFVLHGSDSLDPAHPDGSGGRALALFGPDGVLLVDTENRQVANKTLKTIRSFTSAPIKVL